MKSIVLKPQEYGRQSSRTASLKYAAWILFAVLLAIFACGIASAADTDTATTANEIKELKSTIDQLQSRLSELEAKVTAKPASTTASKPSGPKIDGYVQTRYQADNAQSGLDQFFIRRARLNMRGAVSDHISAKVELKLEGKAAGMAGGSQIQLREAYGQYANDVNTVQMGQMAIPFDYELLTGSTALWSSERALVIDRLFPDQVDLGVKYTRNTGKQSPTVYLGAFNGSGINALDNNTNKDSMASVRIPFKNGNVMVGYYDGKKTVGTELVDHSALGGGLQMDAGPFALQGEYIVGKDAGADVAGWYGQVGYRLPGSTLAFVKYDVFDEDTDSPNDTFKRTTLGIFRDFTPESRVTLACELRSVGQSFSERAKYNGDSAFLQWQVKF